MDMIDIPREPCPACNGYPRGVSGTGYPIRCSYCKGTGRGPVDMVLHCPKCGRQHLDVGVFAVRGHRTHKCENTPNGPGTGCGHEWRPYEYLTRGVRAPPLLTRTGVFPYFPFRRIRDE